jgi:3D (Asp-Asp-Asp) domain-containing protein
MREIMVKIVAAMLLVSTSIVPPWDMPEDATCEAQEALYAEAEEAVEEEETVIQEPEMEYLGTFEMTAYEWTGNPCANGRYPEVGYTVACNSLPLGTTVYIEGVGYRVVEDRGADWHASNWMDLYLGDVASCYEWGIRSVEVYIVK